MYASPNSIFLANQKFFACPCAEGYSRLIPDSNEPCVNCGQYVENCHKCELNSGQIKCIVCESEYFMLT